MAKKETKNRCCKQVSDAYSQFFRTHQCPNKGKVKKDGKWYCGTHDPDKIAAKEKIKQEKWDKEAKDKKELFERTKILFGMAEGIPTEKLKNYKILKVKK